MELQEKAIADLQPGARKRAEEYEEQEMGIERQY
jgi:hypothetical protein